MGTSTSYLTRRIQWGHNQTLSMAESLADEQLAQWPGPATTPIGWHVWHVARTADRLQASLPVRGPATDDELWSRENYPAKWGFSPEQLGFAQIGTMMTDEDAARLAALGSEVLLEYARQAFAIANEAIGAVSEAQMDETRTSLLPMVKRSPEGELFIAGDRETTTGDDLLFHLGHTNRHIGCIEVLLSVIFDKRGGAI